MSARTGKSPAPRPARTKSNRLEARLTDEQKALLQLAAELRGQSLTEFVVSASEDAATQALERAGVMVLSQSDSAAFVEAVLNPPEPGPECVQPLRATVRIVEPGRHDPARLAAARTFDRTARRASRPGGFRIRRRRPR